MQYGGNRTRDSELQRVKDVRESNSRDPGLKRVKDVMFVDNLWCLFVVCKQVCMLCIACVVLCTLYPYWPGIRREGEN